MQRTISAMVGKGSVNHNSRKFKAENVDGSRTHLNIDYCNEPIKKIYHELFDEALKIYNEKQTRADRRIENYYEKIRNSKQEREKEVAQLSDEISRQEDKLELVKSRINNMLDCENSLDNVVKNFDKDPQYQLPDSPALMSAKTYKTKIAQPIINALRELVQGVIIKYFKMKNTLEQWRQANQNLYHDNNRLSEKAKNLENINAKQKAELQDYKLLRKVFGSKHIDDMLKQAKEITQSKQREKRFRNYKDER